MEVEEEEEQSNAHKSSLSPGCRTRVSGPGRAMAVAMKLMMKMVVSQSLGHYCSGAERQAVRGWEESQYTCLEGEAVKATARMLSWTQIQLYDEIQAGAKTVYARFACLQWLYTGRGQGAVGDD